MTAEDRPTLFGNARQLLDGHLPDVKSIWFAAQIRGILQGILILRRS